MLFLLGPLPRQKYTESGMAEPCTKYSQTFRKKLVLTQLDEQVVG